MLYESRKAELPSFHGLPTTRRSRSYLSLFIFMFVRVPVLPRMVHPMKGCSGRYPTGVVIIDGCFIRVMTRIPSTSVVYTGRMQAHLTPPPSLNSPTNQPSGGQPWSPNLERALFNRTVRMSIYCNNVNEREDGYVLFKVGDGNGYFDINVADYEAILTDSGSSAFATPWGGGAAGRGWLSSAFTFVVVGALTAWVGKLSESS